MKQIFIKHVKRNMTIICNKDNFINKKQNKKNKYYIHFG